MQNPVLPLTVRMITLCLLAAPLLAQGPDLVTRANGGPATYVPLSPNVSIIGSAAVKGGSISSMTPKEMLAPSAGIHGAAVLQGPSRAFAAISPNASNGAAAPFTSLGNAVSFILHQLSGTAGLPVTYSLPSGITTGNQAIDGGVGLYDTSLALLALVDNGNMDQAKRILDIYNSNVYGYSVLSASPTKDNANGFSPFDNSAYYYFDFANAAAKFDPRWQQYSAHTGPNAWISLAACQYVQAQRQAGVGSAALAPYVAMATRIGDAMIRLQDSQTQGGIRYGPNQSDGSFNEINTENVLSAYTALMQTAGITGQSKYQTAAANALNWLKNATLYNPLTGKNQQGMLDRTTGMFFVHALFRNGRWEIQPQIAEDSAGSWAISALGPETIDSIWGQGAALAMWNSIRANFGRTTGAGGNQSIRNAGPQDPLTGLDFSNLYPSDQALISPEWTAGGVNALKQLISYYREHPLPRQGPVSQSIVRRPPPRRPPVVNSTVLALSRDLGSMLAFLSQGVTAYAIGPGLAGARQGQTGFGWQAPSDSVAAMAAIYGTLPDDPLAAWRTPSANR